MSEDQHGWSWRVIGKVGGAEQIVFRGHGEVLKGELAFYRGHSDIWRMRGQGGATAVLPRTLSDGGGEK